PSVQAKTAGELAGQPTLDLPNLHFRPYKNFDDYPSFLTRLRWAASACFAGSPKWLRLQEVFFRSFSVLVVQFLLALRPSDGLNREHSFSSSVDLCDTRHRRVCL